MDYFINFGMWGDSMKIGDCILIKPKDKWLCVKYYDHDDEHVYYVPMHLDMLHKRHIKKLKRSDNNVRDIHQGKTDKGVNGLEFN